MRSAAGSVRARVGLRQKRRDQRVDLRSENVNCGIFSAFPKERGLRIFAAM